MQTPPDLRTAPSHIGSTVPPARSHRRPDIQGLRAIAVLMVVVYHGGWPLPGGFVGVDVFFVISGFVITAMLWREWSATGRVRLVRFYLRRFKRLSPALAVTVAATMVLSVFLLSPLGTQQDASRTAIGSLLLSANFVISRITGNYFDLSADTNALLHTWSLSVEEQFYVVFPLILVAGWVLSRRTRKPSAPVVILMFAAATSLGLALAGAAGWVPTVEPWLVGFYSPLTRIWEFAAGAFLALLGQRVQVTRRWLAEVLGVAGATLLALSLVVISGSDPFPGPLTLIPVLGSVALLLAGGFPESFTQRALSWKPLVRIGDWSYSIYLWHWPLIVFALLKWPATPWVAAVAAAASFVVAIASYRWVEEPLRVYNPSSKARLVAFIAATVAIPMALAIGVWQASDHGFWNPEVKAFQDVIFAQPEGCSLTLSPTTVDHCTRNADASGKPIYLLGDSNAGQFAEGLVETGRTLDRPVILSTTNACPFLDLYFERRTHSDTRNQQCRDRVQKSLQFLDNSQPGLVMIANIDSYWMEKQYAVGATAETTTDESAKLQALQAGLQSTVHRLRQAGHEVMIVQTIPRWIEDDTWRTAACNAWDVVVTKCEQSMTVESAEARQGAVRTVISSVAATSGAKVLDPWEVLCSDETCSTQGQEFPRYYRDGSHISVPEGKMFAPALKEAIEREQA